MIKYIFTIVLLVTISSFSQTNNSNLDYLYPSEGLEFKYHDDWGRDNYKKVINEFKKKPLQLNDIVFLGNSLTASGQNWSERLNHPNIKNRGIGGDVSDGVYARLEEVIYIKPKAVFLLIGINDLWNNGSPNIPSPEYIGVNIIKIARYIKIRSPESKVYVQTILPIREKKYKDVIKKVNQIIKSRKNTGFKVLDLYSVFVNKNGLITENYTTDGIHLNEKGYIRWTNFIKPIIISLKD